MRKALITGITGQDGSYLAELLLEKGYQVYGLARRSSHSPYERIRHLLDRVRIVDADLTDQASVDQVIAQLKPDEVYNLAAQSFVAVSWKQAVLTGDVTGLGVTRLLDSIHRHCPRARFYQASSSEMYGRVTETPQRETTPFHPRSPYAAAKVYAHHITVNYRESFGLFAVSGICFNHESPRRGLEFVTRKVTHGAARIKLGLAERLSLGNLQAKRDWGFAGDYVEAMWRMLQHGAPEDFVIATGSTHSIEKLVELAFGIVGLNWRNHVDRDESLLRPAEVDALRGDASKARDKLGWRPRVGFSELIEMMVRADLELLSAHPEETMPFTAPLRLQETPLSLG